MGGSTTPESVPAATGGVVLASASAWRRRFAVGASLGKKLTVERILGENDMTLSVAAFQKRLGQPVTVDILLPDLAGRPDVASCFLREAKRAAGLRSDHAVRILDVGRLGTREPFLVRERLDAIPLSEALPQHGAFSISRATELVAQACDAVGEAHARGRTHGDLKPATLFLAARSRGLPVVKVGEFGMSTVRATFDGSGSGHTPARMLHGEALYLAPEQLDPSLVVDARADVWALGAILYELLVGKAPFAGPGIAQIVRLIAQGAVIPPSALRAGVPIAMDDIVLRCLDKDPSRRWADATELSRALDEVVEDQSQTSVAELSMIVDRVARESATEVRPFVPDAPVAAPSDPPPSGPLASVGAPSLGSSDSIIPSVVTGSDVSQPALHVRPHPLVGYQPPPMVVPMQSRTAVWIFLAGVAFAALVIGILLFARN